MLKNLTPMLRTGELKETIAFYTERLGFSVEGSSEEAGWAHLRRDSVSIMLASPNAHEDFQRPALTGSLYIVCDKVDDIWNDVRESTRVCYPIESFDYGMREFAIYDNNGYLLQFGEEIGSDA